MALDWSYRSIFVLGILALFHEKAVVQAVCGIPQTPVNGNVEYTSLELGSIALYTCYNGYNIMGATSVTCLYGGVWSEPAPTCEPVDCGTVASNPNSFVDCASGTLYGSTCTVSCDYGYTMTGSPTLVCLASGLWDMPPPTCTIVDCGNVVSNPNSFVDCSGGTTYGSMCTTGCDLGYFMTGSTFLQCLASGIWDFPPPTCTIIDCLALIPPQDGTVSYIGGTTYGSMGVYACYIGFSLSGFETQTCQASGVWSDTPPYCLPDVCVAPIPPTRGSVSCGSLLLGDTCTFICDTGYTLNGASVVTCLQSGLWDFTEPTCLYTGITGCNQEWASPSLFSMHSHSSSQSYSTISSSPVVSELACVRMCRNQAEVLCGTGDECSFIEYDPTLKLCTMFKEDEFGGSSIVCSGTNKCYRRFTIV